MARSGQVAEDEIKGFAITDAGAAALRRSGPRVVGQAERRAELRYLTQCEHRLLRALASVADGTPMIRTDIRAAARLSSPGFYHAAYQLLAARCIEQLAQFPVNLVITTRGRDVLVRTRVRGDHTWDLRDDHADLLRQVPVRHARLHFDVVPPPFRSAVIAYLEVIVAKGRKIDTL